jgi:hypothetical protein
MGVLNRMIKEKGTNIEGKSVATCKKWKTGEGPIDSLKYVIYIISIIWFHLAFVVCRISALTGLYFFDRWALNLLEP